MTRLASDLGIVAVVAVVVVLSGCNTAVKTDYAENLAGTWMSAAINRDVPNPADTEMMIPVTTVITATIGADEADAFMLSVTDTPPAGEPIPTRVVGTFTATADSITVTVTEVVPAEHPQAQLVKDVPPVFSYELSETELKLGGAGVVAFKLVPSATDQLTLTRQ